MDERRDDLIEQIISTQERLGTMLVAHRLGELAAQRLTATQIHALALLDVQGPQPAGDLARALGVTGATATGIVDRLEAAGLVTREPGADDARVRIVTVTEQGSTAWRDAVLRPGALDRELLDRLTPAELDHFAQGVAGLLRVADEVLGEGRTT